MKKFFILLLLLPLGFRAAAEEVETTLGYCAGADALTAQTANIGVAGTRMSGAIRLPRETMMRYQGGRVTRIRFALAGNGAENCSVWLRRQLGERSAVVQSVPTVSAGWNEVELNKPLDIDGEELYVGFTAQQTTDAKLLLHTGVAAADAAWVAEGNNWASYYNFGVGALLIEAVVEADIKDYDLGVITLQAPVLQAAGAESVLPVTCEVENMGRNAVEGFRATCSVDGVVVGRETFNASLQPAEVLPFTMDAAITSTETGAHEVQVAVEPLSGTDEKAGNDVRTQTFYLYGEEDCRSRHVLLEHFTSIPCVQCPAADAMIEGVVSQRSDIIWVSHHVGYRDDELTLEASRAYTAFGVTGNPEVIIDRRTQALPETGAVPAFPANGLSAAGFDALLTTNAERPAFVAIDVDVEVEADNVRVSVTGDAVGFFQDLFPDHRLNVFLVEDGVRARVGQAGNPTKFVHDNITRAIPTGSRGVPIAWEGGSFAYTATVGVEEGWKTDALRAVAFITSGDKEQTAYPTGEVLNAAQCAVAPTDGIALPAAETQAAGATAYYDLQGRRVTRGAGGIYIRKSGKQTGKIFIQQTK
ncbi:MAG: Omp28-related outer membrane protein [Alloprevotella sp.]|nr:Omp28-related outer membrane protein [Alloprevotella sp.]